MWANAQRDGRPAEHRWRPLFNAAKFGCMYGCIFRQPHVRAVRTACTCGRIRTVVRIGLKARYTLPVSTVRIHARPVDTGVKKKNF